MAGYRRGKADKFPRQDKDKEIITNNKIYQNYRRNHIFKANMTILSKRYPEIVAKLESCSAGDRYTISDAENGMPNVYLRELKRYYYDQKNPLEDVLRELNDLGLKNTRMALFLGMGLGYEVLYYIQHMADTQHTSQILIIEKDPLLFIAALRSVDLTVLLSNPHIQILVGVKEEELYTKLRDYLAKESRFMLLKTMKPVYYTSSLRLHKDYYIKTLQIFRDAAKHQVLNYGNDPYDSLIGVENMLVNLGEIVTNPGINLLYNQFQCHPAIIVATGPSLNKNKFLLKGLEDKALIIAADASLKILVDMGVKPHLVTSLERIMPTVKLLQGFTSDQVKDVFLAACPVVRPEMYQVYSGPRIIVYRNFDHFRWINIDKGILDIKLSAGNMAFKVAEALGCDPIILIGQDLAFSRDGQTHASGTTFGEKQEDVYNEQSLEVMGNDGNPIQTTETWYSFLKSYELDLAGYGGTCVNCTEGGAYITGTQVMPFRTAIDKYIREPFYPLDIIKNSLGSFSSAQAKQDIEKTLVLVEETIRDLTDIIEECKKGIELYYQYKIELEQCLVDDEKLNELRNSLSAIENELLTPKRNCSKSHRTFQLFFAHIFQAFNIKFEMEMLSIPEKYDDFGRALADILLRQGEWFAVVGDLANICRQSLEKAYKELFSKRENQNESNQPV
ncbi:MAG: 6-hydroxymethylpterin diphosphokinase MptE-like protein [Syntrophomonas sp.]